MSIPNNCGLRNDSTVHVFLKIISPSPYEVCDGGEDRTYNNTNSYTYDSSDEDQIRESLNARPDLMKTMGVKRSDIPPTPAHAHDPLEDQEETIYRDNYG